MKSYSKKLKIAVASVVSFITVLGTPILAFAERGTYTVPVIEDKKIYIGLGVFALACVVFAVVMGIIIRRSQNTAHKKWLKENNMTEEEYVQQVKSYKQQDKQRKADLRAKKKARNQALRNAKKF